MSISSAHYLPGTNKKLGDRYLLGDQVSSTGPTEMNAPIGNIGDAKARIWPFKIHLARQPFDAELGHLLQPVTSGEGGFWTEFDWDQALRLGSEVVGLDYSGQYDFAETEMYWPITHMVAPADEALQCAECHSENGPLEGLEII